MINQRNNMKLPKFNYFAYFLKIKSHKNNVRCKILILLLFGNSKSLWELHFSD